MTQEKGMTYAGTGVDYDAMDPFKRLAQASGRATAVNLRRFGFNEIEWSRGESVYLFETPDCYLAHVEEGLGTKNWVAEAMYKLTGKTYYDQMAQDTVAMIVNDMITLGALPVSVAMHLAVGDSDWFKDEQRSTDLAIGWQKACDKAGCVWGGGETPTLKGLPDPLLAGSALGIIKPKDRIIDPANIRHGDAIILVASSGIHANGLTLAREISEKLPKKYLTELSDGRTYGETLLDPTPIYVPLIEACLNGGVDIHYTINVTGHGWRKLMRAVKPFKYVVEVLPPQLPIFDFIQEHGPLDDREAYGNLNMGAGFALFVPETHVAKTLEVIAKCGFDALEAGHIEESSQKQVIIEPKGLVYDGSELGVR
ncbi:MAG: AIR synthase-related protein [Patescibacteria group bacterium]